MNSNNMILHDIMEQWDIEDNFEYCFSKYVNHLERGGKWNLCEDNKTKNNFKYRMRQVKKNKIEPSKEWKTFENWVEKMKVNEQKDVERRAIKLDQQWKDKYEKLLEDYQTLKKDYENVKQQLKDKDNQYENLLNKYIMECDSDDD
jgi:hypothetical protein